MEIAAKSGAGTGVKKCEFAEFFRFVANPPRILFRGGLATKRKESLTSPKKTGRESSPSQ
ncbi:hypothetical protein NIES2104_21280 [Leptolyngbya sp. NIES-2104]|nr:hypothetical protein NIES2104_21280 [Leptolyngbya sp. NIES-2104]